MDRHQIVFSDVDGTLLDTQHKILPGSLLAIKTLEEKNIPFVIISGRGPTGLFPLLDEYHFSCPLICFNGALILDRHHHVLYEVGYTKDEARGVLTYLENSGYDVVWNLYTRDHWIVKNRKDPRTIVEEDILKIEATEGSVELLSEDEIVSKILCECPKDALPIIKKELETRFPHLSIGKSSEVFLEIMAKDVNKSRALAILCELLNIPVANAIAFGDNYNDIEMLQMVGLPFVMGNAPFDIRKTFTNVTDTNDNEGIYKALYKLGLLASSN